MWYELVKTITWQDQQIHEIQALSQSVDTLKKKIETLYSWKVFEWVDYGSYVQAKDGDTTYTIVRSMIQVIL